MSPTNLAGRSSSPPSSHTHTPAQAVRSGSLDLDDIFSPSGGSHRPKVGHENLGVSGARSQQIERSQPRAVPSRGVRRYHSDASSLARPKKPGVKGSSEGPGKKPIKMDQFPSFLRDSNDSGKGSKFRRKDAASSSNPTDKKSKKKSKPSRTKSGGLLDLIRPPPKTEKGGYYNGIYANTIHIKT